MGIQVKLKENENILEAKPRKSSHFNPKLWKFPESKNFEK
jgi:hypothetical protein